MAKRKNRQVAIVTVARKLVTIAYLMLKNNEPYRYSKLKLMAEKFSALDRATAGKTSRSRQRQPGPSAQARAGLAAVYANAGLPKVSSPEELAEGEQRIARMLFDSPLHPFDALRPVDHAAIDHQLLVRVLKRSRGVGECGSDDDQPENK